MPSSPVRSWPGTRSRHAPISWPRRWRPRSPPARNVSPQVAAQYKRASIAGISALGALLLRSVPELGEPDAFRLAGAAVMTTAAVWPHTQPSAAMLAAYAADPALAAMRLDFTATLREVLEVLIAGLLARTR